VARKQRLSSIQQISDINLTPLMDLTFILLITFIITFPLLEQGIPIDLPTGDAAPLEDPQGLVITLDKDGGLFLDERKLEKEELARDIKDLVAMDPELTVMVRGDEGIQYGKVVEVMKILHDANVTRMALVTQAESQ
jgi:biopolymer transport protein TolR